MQKDDNFIKNILEDEHNSSSLIQKTKALVITSKFQTAELGV